MGGTTIEVWHEARTLLKGVTGDFLVLDVAEIEPGDLVFFGGHLIRRAKTAPRERRYDRNYFRFDAESLDGVTQGRDWNVIVGSSYLVLRPTVG